MNFDELLSGAKVVLESGNPAIRGLHYDSRRIRPGDVFLALRGGSSDGNQFIDEAIARGAVAVVTDSESERPRSGVGWALVRDGRVALAHASANFFHHPAEQLRITGVTGTNGKSTTTFLIESILKAAGRTSALIGTIEYHVAEKILPAPHTTPEALELNRLLREAQEQGATEVVMEVSSHALVQQRVLGIPFDVAAFTNLSRDHLDYHRTMDEYFQAKQILFRGSRSKAPRVAVINLDDESGQSLMQVSQRHASQVLTYGWSRGDFHADKVEIRSRSTRFELVTPHMKIPLRSSLVGRVNVYNILAAASAAYAGKVASEAIEKGVLALTHVPGRFQPINCGQPFSVVVDYAHTDDALRNLTVLAREFIVQGGGSGRVITIFGCGGDRDRAKRPLMGEAAGRGSDFVVLTSDNPRSEDPRAIINDALVGLQRTPARYTIEPDRKAAIALGLAEARPGDIVLVAGKGHEKVQVSRQGSIAFDDVEVARRALAELGYHQDLVSGVMEKGA